MCSASHGMRSAPNGMFASPSLRCDLLPSMRAAAQTTCAPLKHRRTLLKHTLVALEIERAPLHRTISAPEGHTPAPPAMRAFLAGMRARQSTAVTFSPITYSELSATSHSSPITSHFPHIMFTILPLMVRPPPGTSPIPSTMRSRRSTTSSSHSATASDAHGARSHFCVISTISTDRLSELHRMPYWTRGTARNASSMRAASRSRASS